MSLLHIQLNIVKNILTCFEVCEYNFSSDCETPLIKLSVFSPNKLSPLLVLARIFSPSKKVFLPRPKDEEGLALCLSLISFFVFSDELLGFLTTSSSKESKLSSAFLTVGELGNDIARSKASSIDRFCSRVSCELYLNLLFPRCCLWKEGGDKFALMSQCLFKSVSDLKMCKEK